MAFVDISPPIYVSIPKNNGMTVEMLRHPGAVVPIPSGAQGLPGEPGFSPVVSVEEITGGNRVTITDAEGETSFDVMNGAQGEQGEPGEGVPAGGVTGQVLRKASSADYDGEWYTPATVPTKVSDLTNDSGFVDASGAAAAAPVQSVNGATGAVTVPTPTYNQTTITSGTHDLNDYTTPGLYYFSSGTTLSNAPNSAVNGWLIVLAVNTGNVRKQIWLRHGSNPRTTKETYMRLVSGGTWGVWARVGEVPIHFTASITSLPHTVTDSRITAGMRVIEAVLGTPSAVTTDLGWTTANGSIVFSGTLASGGNTTLDFDLIEVVT